VQQVVALLQTTAKSAFKRTQHQSNQMAVALSYASLKGCTPKDSHSFLWIDSPVTQRLSSFLANSETYAKEGLYPLHFLSFLIS